MRNFPETFDVEFTDLMFHHTIDPALAVAEFRLTGTAVPTGKPYEQTCISVVRTNADGLITGYDDYWNPLVAIEALQAEPVAEPGADGVAKSFGSCDAGAGRVRSRAVARERGSPFGTDLQSDPMSGRALGAVRSGATQRRRCVWTRLLAGLAGRRLRRQRGLGYVIPAGTPPRLTRSAFG